MGHNLIGQKGQVSIEFMLLLMIMLIYIQTIIQPTIAVSSQTAEEINRLGQARLAAEKLANTIDLIGSTNGLAKQTFRMIIPKKSEITCNSVAIGFVVELEDGSEEVTACNTDDDGDNKTCTWKQDLDRSNIVNCSAPTFGPGPLNLDVIVEKKTDGVIYVTG